MVTKKEKEQKAAKAEITKHIRELVKFNITVPLGNPNYKLIHTNSFISTKLPSDFVIANLGIIGTQLKSADTRGSTYVKNRWYVEAVTINNDGNKATMELELNPFASSISNYKDEYKSFSKAYTDAVKQAQNQSSTNAKTTTSTSKNKSTGSTSMDKAVDNAIKGKTKPLDKAKAIDKAFKNHVIYSYYSDAQKTHGSKKYFESAWKNGHLNCADGANLLCAMFIRGGFTATIIHVTKHYIVRVTVNGKYYYTDNAASTGKHTTRAFGKTYNGMTKGSNVGTITT